MADCGVTHRRLGGCARSGTEAYGGGSRTEASAVVNVKFEGRRIAAAGALSNSRDSAGSVRGAPGGSLPYQARIPCNVDTPALPCGIPGLCTAFKSPTLKFTKLLLVAAVAG